MQALAFVLVAFTALVSPASAGAHQANPVRKVVTLLQSMQSKVTAEGEKEEELYKKFSCYCKTGAAELSASISAAEVKGPSLSSDLKASEESLAQTQSELKDAQKDRTEAKAAIASATAIREKAAAAFAGEKGELEGYISAITKAVAALEKGMAGSFLQTTNAQTLKKILLSSKSDVILDDEKETVLAFLSGKQSYAPASGEITGILKELGDSMAKSLADATAAEGDSIKEFEALVAAKAKEIEALTSAVESKTSKVGELGMTIVTIKNDMSDTETALVEDKKMLAELAEGCSTKDKEFEERVKTRNEELAAIAETIKILNDDDALELFKKTLPAPSASLVQMRETSVQVRDGAIAAIQQVASSSKDRARLDFILLALRGKTAGFEKVIKMIDDMVSALKVEQTDDANKKEYCAAQFDSAEDKAKKLALTISDTETAITSAEEGISKVAEEIAALEAGIKDLDKQVAEATLQRKEENEDYKSLVQSDAAAKELLLFAKNRLNKFYNPKLYNPPAKVELSTAGAIERDMVFAQVSAHRQRQHVEPPPATWDAYAKKSEESTGVISMIDLLVADLDKEVTEAEVEEKNSQQAYDQTIADAKEKRTSDSKSLTSKGASKADMEADLETAKDTLKSTKVAAMATAKYTSNLHAECDWLLQYFDVRKEARAGEVDALLKAKAVLAGADYSLLQTRAALRGRA
jgi:septal ring factor EnvC (AmiA/AmiB activator)